MNRYSSGDVLLTLPLHFRLPCFQLDCDNLNIFSALGILLLFGYVKKNAILQIDHTRASRQRNGTLRRDYSGEPRPSAPILMTTIALVAGMIPLVVAAARARQRIAQSVFWSSADIDVFAFNTLAVPVFYSIFEDIQESTIWQRVGGRASAGIGRIYKPVRTKLANAFSSFGRKKKDTGKDSVKESYVE